jgi:hypothetical protein
LRGWSGFCARRRGGRLGLGRDVLFRFGSGLLRRGFFRGRLRVGMVVSWGLVVDWMVGKVGSWTLNVHLKKWFAWPCIGPMPLCCDSSCQHMWFVCVCRSSRWVHAVAFGAELIVPAHDFGETSNLPSRRATPQSPSTRRYRTGTRSCGLYRTSRKGTTAYWHLRRHASACRRSCQRSLGYGHLLSKKAY